MSDAYDYWRRELDLPGSQPRDTGEAILGWWRSRGAKTKHDTPAVIWKDDAGVTWLQRGKSAPAAEGSDQWWGWMNWGFMKADAVATEEYEVAMAKGVWPDGKPAFRKSGDTEREVSSKGGDLIHDPENDGPLIELLSDEIEALADTIERFPPITSMKMADRAAELYRRMRTLWKQADNARIAEKEPHLRAGREVDAGWKPALDKASDYGGNINDQVKLFIRAEERRRAEEERQRREEEQKKWQEEQAAGRAAEPAPEPKPIETPKVTARPASGGLGISLRTVRKGRITNETKFINAIKKRSDFQEIIQKIADQLAKANQPTNGMEIYEDRV